MIIHITCPKGISDVLAREVADLGLPVNAVLPAGVVTEGTLADCIRCNLWLRTAHRVLLRLHSFTADTPHEMYEGVTTIPWEEWIPRDGYLSVISSIATPSIDNTQFANVRCKDAIVDRLRAIHGIRPDSGSRTDRSVVFLYWHGSNVSVAIDTSGASLSDRGYRLQGGKAPLRETLAAAMLLSTTWQPGQAVVNPMGGSGTLAIEAAMLDQRIAPGTLRSNFGFMHVLPYDSAVYRTLRAEAQAAQQPATAEIVCTDHDRRMIDAARENARRAGVDKSIRFGVCDFQKTPVPPPPGIVIFNPEYGLRLGDITALRETYRSIGDFMKQQCRGYTGYVFTGNMDLTKEVGLRASRRIPFWNADVECRLLQFELYEGSRK